MGDKPEHGTAGDDKSESGVVGDSKPEDGTAGDDKSESGVVGGSKPEDGTADKRKFRDKLAGTLTAGAYIADGVTFLVPFIALDKAPAVVIISRGLALGLRVAIEWLRRR